MARQDFLRGELVMLAFTVLRATALRQSPAPSCYCYIPTGYKGYKRTSINED
jgi:hypothetical protein